MSHNEWTDWYDQSLPAEQSAFTTGTGTAAAPVPGTGARTTPGPETGEAFQVPEAQATKRGLGHHAGMKATMLVLSVLVLVVASVYVFSDHFGFLRSAASRRVESVPGSGSDSGWSWSFGPIEPNERDAEDYGDDFRAFFEDFYETQESNPQGSNLERSATAPEISVQLHSTEGKQELSLQELYHKSIDSIVGIEAFYDGDSGYGWGTGIVMTADGYIVTNEHIIDLADTAKVVLSDGTEYDALLVGEDTLTDIAVLKIEASGLQPAEFGESAALAVGDPVVALGNPLGDELRGTMTNGIISAIDRDIQVNGRSMTLLQTNAALNEGNSGGPLFNQYGQVVGITNLKMVNYYSGVTIEGIGFAIPSSTVKLIADQLMAQGEVLGRPGLGITVGIITDEAKEEFHLPDGLYIYAVSEGSDAFEKGVKEGDILTHVNGQAVAETEDVLTIRDASQVGDTLVLTLYRDGETFDVSIVLREMNRLY